MSSALTDRPRWERLKLKVYQGVGRYLPFLKLRPPTVDRKAAMTLRPGRNAALTYTKQETGETVLTVPQNEKVNPLMRTMARLMRVPKERRIELDEVGGFVWELCDGNHPVESIVQKTARQYKMNRREAEVSVTMFLQMLHERNFIGFYQTDPKTDPKTDSKTDSQPSSESEQRSTKTYVAPSKKKSLPRSVKKS